MHNKYLLIALAAVALGLPACGGGGSGGSTGIGGTNNNSGNNGGGNNGGGSSGGGNTGGNPPSNTTGRTFLIKPGPTATTEALRAFIAARPQDVVEFDCGYFDINKTLLLTHTEQVTIKGCGMDKTVLSFRNSDGAEGILIDDAGDITIEDMTVADTDGNAFELRSVDHGTLNRVRAFWSSGGGREAPKPITAANYQNGQLDVACTSPPTLDPRAPENKLLPGSSSPDYTPSDKAGRYGIYPVKSKNILVDNSESVGASDAGIYVGQTSTAIIRNSHAIYNVFGFEIENVRHGEYSHNLAECNTGGFLVYDLDNLTQYGERTIMHDNIARMNNTYNFTEGGFVSNVPSGSGMVTLAYDLIDVYDNEFIGNNTAGIIHTSYQIFPEGAGRPTDQKIDFYTEGLHIFRNKFRNNGNSLPLPTTNDLQNQDIVRLLPALIGLKNAAGCVLDPTRCPLNNLPVRGAHILWDGLLPAYRASCPYPKGANGQPVPEEENIPGKPRHTNEDPNPACHYNGYKFDTGQPGNPRKTPEFYASCIDDNNDFGPESIKFANFRGTRGLESVLALTDADLLGALNLSNLSKISNFPSDFRLAAHNCEVQYGRNLARIDPVVIPPFVPSGDFDPAPSPAQVAALCEAGMPAGQVNFDAAAEVDCPSLDQYHLFADPANPTSTPNGPRSFPFVLNTKLFSDYSVKYRIAYLPPGTSITYAAPGAGQPTGTIVFPLGTVIAKTFTFLKNGTETPVETRLLIKRENNSGTVRWVGLPYVWQTNSQGQHVALLQVEGATRSVSWNYTDVDTGEQLSGAAPSYSVPNANQCLSCHANRDLESGTAPIGPKIRNLNRPYESESTVQTGQSVDPIAHVNQIAYLCNNGWMSNCPANLGVNPSTQIAQNLPRLPKYKVAGDSGETPNSDADIEARTRAWLEVNCEHCHNPQGFAANTGFYLDTFRQVDTSYGICKGPTASGAEGSGGRSVDIKPGDANGSILAFRIGPEATTAAARMPPIARSVVNDQAVALIRQWINTVVVADNSRYPGSQACAGN